MEQKKLCNIVFVTGLRVSAYVTELRELEKEPLVFIHDIEVIQTGYCPIRLIEYIEYMELDNGNDNRKKGEKK